MARLDRPAALEHAGRPRPRADGSRRSAAAGAGPCGVALDPPTVWWDDGAACRTSARRPQAPRRAPRRNPRTTPGGRRSATHARRRRRHPERHAALLVPLTQHHEQPVPVVDVVDVRTARLADPNTSGPEQLDDRTSVRPSDHLAASRIWPPTWRQVPDLVATPPVAPGAPWAPAPGRGVTGQQAASGRPRGERLDRRRAARQRGAGRTGTRPGGKPRPQDRKAHPLQTAGRGAFIEKREQRPQIPRYARRVCAERQALQFQVTVELVEDRLHYSRSQRRAP